MIKGIKDLKRQKLLIIALTTILMSIIVVLLTKHPAEAGWWNDSWEHRKKIPVTNNTSAETNVYVDVSIDSSDSDKFQADCGGIRFTTYNGVVLPYYISSGCGTGSTSTQVFFDTLDAGSQTIYVYYGNPSVENGFESSAFDTEASNYTIGTLGTEEITPGPIAVWKFDETSGTTAYDATLQGNHLSLGTGGSAPTQTLTGCNAGNCLSFDGTYDHLKKASDSSFDFGTDSFTISGWFKHDTTITGTDTVVSKYDGAGYKIYMNSSGYLCFAIDDDSTWTPDDSACTTTDYSDDEWHYFSAVKDGTSSLYLYIDGELANSDSSLTATGNLSPSSDFFVGTDSHANFWDGMLDEVRVYPYSRTSAQILNDMATRGISGEGTTISIGTDTTMPTPLIHLTLDEGRGTTSYDKGSCGSNCDAVGVGNSMPTWTLEGKYGGAVDLETDDSEYLTCGNPTELQNLPNGDFSVATWIKIESHPSGYQHQIIGKDDDDWKIFFQYDGKPHFFIDFGAGTDAGIRGDTILSTDEWHHVVGTFNSTTNEPNLYIDGGLVSYSGTNGYKQNGAGSYSGDTSSDFIIGAREDLTSTTFFDGIIDEVKIYSKVLTSKEIGVAYLQEKAAYFGAVSTESSFGAGDQFSASREYCIPGDTSTCNTPLAEWKIDEASGETIYDTSGNENNGTLRGTLGTNNVWLKGKIGAGLWQDGVSGGYDFEEPGITDSFTVEYWEKIDGTLSYAWNWSRIQYDWNKQGVYFAQFECNAICIGSYTSGVEDYYCFSNEPNTCDGEWHHKVFDYDGTNDTITLYIDGKYIDSGNLDQADWSSGGTTRFFDYANSNNSSTYDLVRIYDYALTPAQVAWSYNRGKPLYNYKFDECQGTTIYNSTLDNNGDAAGTNGTLSIGATGDQTTAGNCGIGSTAASWYNGIDGKFGGALSLDGTDDYVSVGDTTRTDMRTLSFWIKPDSTTEDIIELSASHAVEIASGTVTVTGFGTETVYVDGVETTSIPDTDWHHIVVISDADMDVDAMNIGKISSTYYDGLIDEIQLFNYELTKEQVLMLYNQSAAVRF